MSGLLADAVGSSTWTVGIVGLWNASVDNTASTYFLATHSKTSLCKFDPKIEGLSIL
jgi:hypothetical protein